MAMTNQEWKKVNTVQVNLRMLKSTDADLLAWLD